MADRVNQRTDSTVWADGRVADRANQRTRLCELMVEWLIEPIKELPRLFGLHDGRVVDRSNNRMTRLYGLMVEWLIETIKKLSRLYGLMVD